MDNSLFDPQFLDQSAYSGSRTYYAICSTPRTGSNLLCEILREQGIGVPMEYFHPTRHMPDIAKQHRLVDEYIESEIFESVLPGLEENGDFLLRDYIRVIKSHRTSPNGFFGFKAHWSQFKYLKNRCDLNREFPGIKWIYIDRDNKVAQAVSFSKAACLKQWDSSTKTRNKLIYDGEHIEGCINSMLSGEKNWLNWFDQNQINPIRIRYEKLISSPNEIVKKLLMSLGVDNHEINIDLENLRIKSQHDETNKQWIEKFLDDHPDALKYCSSADYDQYV